MANFREEILLQTRGESQVIDITSEVAAVASRAGIAEGIVNVFAPGATAGISTIEHESGCIRDLQEALEKVAPRDGYYHHNERWGDGNGFSHVRAALMGPSLTIPLAGGTLMLGTWQQVICVDFDNHPRERRLIVTVSGP